MTGLDLYYIIKKRTDEGKQYRDNWNCYTVSWSGGYRRAMREIDEILDFYISAYVNTTDNLNSCGIDFDNIK